MSAPHQTNPKKREPPLTASGSVHGPESHPMSTSSTALAKTERTKGQDVILDQEPPKKKRRVALTRVGELDL